MNALRYQQANADMGNAHLGAAATRRKSATLGPQFGAQKEGYPFSGRARPRKKSQSDKFISPISRSMHVEYRQNLRGLKSLSQNSIFQPNENYSKQFQGSLLEKVSELPIVTSLCKRPRRDVRLISRSPASILDAPDARDDFYTRLLDWSSDDHIAVALGSQAYLWKKGRTVEINNQIGANDHLNCVRFSPNGLNLFLSSEHGAGKVFLLNDARFSNCAYVNRMGVSAVSWLSENELICGDGLGNLHSWDMRSTEQTMTKTDHLDRIVGLKSNGNYICSGDNSNLAQLWDIRRLKRPLHTIDKHTSAVRAIAFCPWNENLIATGGALGDGRILIHNIATGNLVTETLGGNQICDLVWSTHYRELLSSQGGENQMTIWLYNERILEAQKYLHGHRNRTLNLELSPDGQSVASLGDDETLKIWTCFTKTPGLRPIRMKPRILPSIR